MDIFDNAAKAADEAIAKQKLEELERAKAKAAEQAQEDQAREQENASRVFPKGRINGM